MVEFCALVLILILMGLGIYFQTLKEKWIDFKLQPQCFRLHRMTP